MRRLVWWAVAGILSVHTLSAENANATLDTTEMRGEVTRVQITPGEGMPFVEIKSTGGLTKIYLGSMRYLMVQGFNPKVGDAIVVKVYKTNHGLVAASVTLPAQKKTVRLRDDHGRPVWRGNPRR
jgi:hypothetical protein